MDTNKSFFQRPFILICIFLLIGSSGMYLSHTIQKHRKHKIADQAIISLETYKLKNSHYPVNLDSIGIDKDEHWLYYLPDSTGQCFTLSYSQGIIDVNTISYNCKTKKWEKVFNY
jgi:hypothetical protein